MQKKPNNNRLVDDLIDLRKTEVADWGACRALSASIVANNDGQTICPHFGNIQSVSRFATEGENQHNRTHTHTEEHTQNVNRINLQQLQRLSDSVRQQHGVPLNSTVIH